MRARARAGETRGLFDPDLPAGCRYQPDLITSEAEATLVDEIAGVAFTTFTMRGATARRRVAFFGRTYDAVDVESSPLPPFLLALRGIMASWAGLDATAFEMGLVTEYPPGAPIGWHRDAPQYEIVAGLSLVSPCRMKFRPYRHPAAGPSAQRRIATHEITLEPRSGYLMSGASRWGYEHHIPAVDALRYSVTFRTSRR